MAPLMRILQWNCHSIKNKTEEFSNTLNSNLITVAAISETWLEPDSAFRVRGYNCLRDDRQDGKGGSALFIKKSLPFTPVDVKPIGCPFQVTAVKVFDTTIISLYISPSNKPSKLVLKEMFSKLTPPFIILGDFNAHHGLWGAHNCDRMGRDIVDLLDELDLCIVNDGSPTRLQVPGQRPSMVDLTICNSNIAGSLLWKVLDDPHGSDHYPILIESSNIYPSNKNVKYTSRKPKFLTAKANWNDYSNHTKLTVQSLPSPTTENVAECYEMLVSAVITAAEKFIPVKTTCNKGKPPPAPWWDIECSDAVGTRKKYAKIYSKNMNLENFLKYKHVEAKTKRLLKNKKRQGWKNFCSSLSPEVPLSVVWNSIRRFKGSHVQTVPRPLSSEWVKEFADKLAPQTASNWNETEFTYSFKTLGWMDTHFNLVELREVLNDLTDSSPGVDGIPYSFIKNCDVTTLNYLLSVVNLIFDSGKIPSSWKTQIIVPILKPQKDPNSGLSYRPIALSSSLVKITEHMVKRRLDWYVENEKILPSSQFGFRKRKGTIESVSILTSDIQLALADKETLVGVCLDVCGAFDNVLLDVLLRKLLKIGIPRKLASFIINLLLTRKIQIQVPDSPPLERIVNKGLPQGSVLSPILFNIYTFDLHRSMHPSCKILQYADDLFIYISGRIITFLEEVINICMKNLGIWLTNHGLEISPSKSNVIVFSRERVPPRITVQINNSILPTQVQIRFLGVILDSKLTWNPYVNFIINKCQAGLNTLRAVSRVWWGSHPFTQKLFYNAYIRSHLDYASFLIEPTSKKNLARLDRIQFQSLRLIIGAMRSSPINALQVEAVEAPLHFRRQFLADKFLFKCLRLSNHPLMVKVTTLSAQVKSLQYWRNKSIPLLVKSLHTYSAYKPLLNPSDRLPLYTNSFHIHLIKPNILLSLGIINNHEAPRKLIQILNSKYSGWKIIYTDGSKTSLSNQVGAAFHCPSDQVNKKIKLPKEASIFTAECIAIFESLKYIDVNHNGNFLILSDSLSALQKLNSSPFHYPEDELCIGIRTLIHKLTDSGKEIVLAWIPSHCGIPGNEKADSLAKDAIISGDFLYKFLNPDDIFIKLKENMISTWQNYWDESSKTKGNHFFIIQPTIPSKPWFSRLSLNKFSTSSICRMRIGHCCHNVHLTKIHVKNSAMCECRLDVEDLNHIFFSCPINNSYKNFIPDLISTGIFPPYNIACLLSSVDKRVYKVISSFLNVNGINL